MVELTADRLVLVDGGTAREYAGNMEEYIDFILGRNQPKQEAKPKGTKLDRKAAAQAREDARAAKKKVSEAEAKIARLQQEGSDIDRAMFDPASALPALAKLTMSELVQRRAAVTAAAERAEAEWLQASEQLELQADQV
jgi:ATP-binding cassette subfamily F protein 3